MKSFLRNIFLGFYELKNAFVFHDSWFFLGIHDVVLRYRRSVIGPWWTTISTLVLIISLGLLWSQLFQIELSRYLPFFAIGYILWTFFYNQLNESSMGFIQYSEIIKQVKVPLPSFILRILVRNIIIFFHNFIIIALVIIIFTNNLNLNIFWFFPSFILFVIFMVPLSIITAIFNSKYRDLNPAILSILQLLFFVTPIMWDPLVLPKKYYIALEYNPIYHLLQITREPLLGFYPNISHWIWILCLFFITAILSLYYLGKYKSKIVFWI